MMPHDDANDRGSLPPKGPAQTSTRSGTTALAALSQMELQAAFESAATLAVALHRPPDAAVDVAIAALARVKSDAKTDSAQAPIVEQVLAATRSVVHEGEATEAGGLGEGEEASVRAEKDLEELAARVAGHPLAPAILRCRIEGVDGASEIATVLGASVDDVHAAHKLLRHHLRQMRARESEEGPGAEDAAEGSP